LKEWKQQGRKENMDGLVTKTRSIPWRGVLALIGGFLIQLSLGSFYSFGNMMTYLTSYMRHHGSPDLTYGDFIIVQSVWGMTQGVTMPLSGFLVRWTGARPAMFTGCAIFSLGTALTYFTLEMGLPWVAFTYGFISACGQGIALIPTMTIGMRWFPNQKGLAMGVVVGGFGGGAFIFNQIQTAILNPNNVSTDGLYFEDAALLARVPNLLLLLASLYLTLQMVACFMVTEPSVDEELVPKNEDDNGNQEILMDQVDGEAYVTPKEALKRKEFYMLWVTRFCAVLITQSVSGFYKAFGQSFIADDHFLSFVGAVSSVFNCTGRLFYGILMDRTSYRTAMGVEMVLLTILVSTLSTTSLLGKVGFTIWIWTIYATFPGTYSTQPAVTTQTFGHKYGGTIYGFLFTSDIINNLLVGVLSRWLLSVGGWAGFFVTLSAFGAVALVVTASFPANPSPGHQVVPSNDPENPPLLLAAADIVKPPAVIPESVENETCRADTTPLSEAATDFNEDVNQRSHN